MTDSVVAVLIDRTCPDLDALQASWAAASACATESGVCANPRFHPLPRCAAVQKCFEKLIDQQLSKCERVAVVAMDNSDKPELWGPYDISSEDVLDQMHNFVHRLDAEEVGSKKTVRKVIKEAGETVGEKIGDFGRWVCAIQQLSAIDCPYHSKCHLNHSVVSGNSPTRSSAPHPSPRASTKSPLARR